MHLAVCNSRSLKSEEFAIQEFTIDRLQLIVCNSEEFAIDPLRLSSVQIQNSPASSASLLERSEEKEVSQESLEVSIEIGQI